MTEILDGLHKVQYSLGSRDWKFLDALRYITRYSNQYTRIYLVYVCLLNYDYDVIMQFW